MSAPVYFDHIEVHVNDVKAYCDFLVRLFKGGRYKVISASGTSMFASNDDIHIEVKKRKDDTSTPSSAGFCRPCLRMEHPKEFVEEDLGLTIFQVIDNPDGPTYFFKDHEGVTWHIKSHLKRDHYINW